MTLNISGFSPFWTYLCLISYVGTKYISVFGNIHSKLSTTSVITVIHGIGVFSFFELKSWTHPAADGNVEIIKSGLISKIYSVNLGVYIL